jgi:uncharacterized protein (TIGR02271 family)
MVRRVAGVWSTLNDDVWGRAMADEAVQDKELEQKLVVPVAREELRVGKRLVDTGRGVRIRKTVREQTRHVEQALLSDALDVKRIPVDKIVPLSEAPVMRQEGDTLIVPVLEEILVVEKRLRIKEEIHIIRSTRHETHSGAQVLREEQVSVERFDDSLDPEVTMTDGGINHATNTDSSI